MRCSIEELEEGYLAWPHHIIYHFQTVS